MYVLGSGWASLSKMAPRHSETIYNFPKTIYNKCWGVPGVHSCTQYTRQDW